jgi:ABC-2 type transport system permease protein
LGRSGRAKVVPLGLAGLIALPAVVSVAFTTLAGGAASRFNPITLEGYLQFSTVPLVFFVAAQAPELLVRDQRHRVLTLYFSRALARTDYVGAKYVALVVAIALVIGLPQVILLLGTLFATPSPVDGMAEVAPLLAPAAGRTVVVAALLAGVGLAASAFTARRAFAAATIIAIFLVPSAIISVLVEELSLDGPVALIALGDVVALIDGTSALLFGSEPTTTTVLMSDVPVWLFAAAAVVVALAALGILMLRYRRIAA